MRTIVGGRRSERQIPVRAARLFRPRFRFEARQARFQSHDHVERHLGEGSEKIWVARASRSLVSASRRNKLFKVRDSETPSPTRETRALPRHLLQRAIQTRQDFFFPQDFEQMIKAGPGVA